MRSFLEPWCPKWTSFYAKWTHPNGETLETKELLEYGWSNNKIIEWFMINHPIKKGTRLNISTADYELDT